MITFFIPSESDSTEFSFSKFELKISFDAYFIYILKLQFNSFAGMTETHTRTHTH